jgi:two-component sensor histidine kinase
LTIRSAWRSNWDLVDTFAKDRPKKDETTEALQQLSSRVEAIADAHSTVAESLNWIGRKKSSRVIGIK